jgi:hypothetical protein
LKLFFFLIASILTLAAHAKQFECVGEQPTYTKAAVIVDCDESICSVSGDVNDASIAPEALNLQDCDASRRSETQAIKFTKLAYYDVQGDSCWADYVRVDKALLANGEQGFVSLVKRTGGDQHDASGYQYANLKCTAR